MTSANLLALNLLSGWWQSLEQLVRIVGWEPDLPKSVVQALD